MDENVNEISAKPENLGAQALYALFQLSRGDQQSEMRHGLEGQLFGGVNLTR